MRKKRNAAENSLRAGLEKLSKERLVDFVEELAGTDGRLLPQIASLLAEQHTPDAVALTRRRLAGLRRGKHTYFDFRGAGEFATELEQILNGIERAILPSEPPIALELLAAFIECDQHAFERADDSYGQIGDVFRRACELFGAAAGRCPSTLVAPVLLRLWNHDDYGARATLMRATAPGLEAPVLDGLIESLRRDMHAAEKPVAHPASIGLMEIADATGNPDLYAEACLFGARAGHPVFSLHSAQRYLRAGRAEEALALMPARAELCGGYAHEWTETHIEILRALGRTEEWRAALWAQFVAAPSADALDACLKSVPESENAATRERAREEVLLDDRHDVLCQARFFNGTGDTATAAACLLRRHQDLDGRHYEWLAPLAESLAPAEPLAATALYRALVEGNLAPARSQYYSHGARYYRALEALAPRISAWAPLVTHAEYAVALRAQHGRKTAFWAKVDAGP